MKINWVVICVNPQNNEDGFEVLHTVLYQNSPTEQDINDLEHELATDEELGMVGVKYEMLVVSREVWNDIPGTFEIPEEIE